MPLPLRTARPILLPSIFVAVALMYNLGGYPLLDPDEGRNAEVAREMAESNDYLVPTLNGLPYIDKPVLHFAATALSIDVFGPTEWAVRLPSLVFTLLTLVTVGWFGTQLFDSRVGRMAALAAGATPLTLAFSRTVIFDAALTFFVTVTLVALYLAVERFDRAHPLAHARFTALGWGAMALGVLTKGPIAIVLPLIVALPYALWRRRARALFDLVGLLLFVAILLPWILVMSDAAPGFLHHSIITETFRRFGTQELQRTGPWWYFLPIVVAGALPWSIPALGRGFTWIANRRGPADARYVFLAIWVLVPLLFFTISQSKRPQYILPLVPAVTLVAASFWARPEETRLRRVTGVLLLPLAGVLMAAPAIVGGLLKVAGPVVEAIPGTAWELGGVIAAAAAGVVIWAHRVEATFIMLTLPAAAVPVTSTRLMDAIGADRSSRELAVQINRRLPSEADVVGIRAYPLSLPFYLRRPLILSSPDGRELTSNYLVRTWQDWSDFSPRIRPPDWWLDTLASCVRPSAFVVRRDNLEVRDLLARRLPLIHEDRKYAAYGPCTVTDLAAQPRTPG